MKDDEKGTAKRQSLFCLMAFCIRRLVAEEIGGLVAAVVDDNLLEDDAGVAGVQRQVVRGALAYGQVYRLLHHAAGDGGVVLGVHVGLTVDEGLVEVDGLRVAAVEADGVLMAADVEEVEGRLDDDVDFDRRRAFGQGEAVGERGLADGGGVGREGYGTARAAKVGVDGPLGAVGGGGLIIMLGLHGHIAVAVGEGVACG